MSYEDIHDEELKVIVFKTQLLVTAATSQLFPVSNTIATNLLCQLLELKLEAQGVTIETLAIVGELNACGGLLVCSERGQAAAEIIRSTLASIAIVPPAGEVFIYDHRELIFRPFKSDSREMVTLDNIVQISNREAENNVRVLADIFKEQKENEALLDMIKTGIEKL